MKIPIELRVTPDLVVWNVDADSYAMVFSASIGTALYVDSETTRLLFALREDGLVKSAEDPCWLEVDVDALLKAGILRESHSTVGAMPPLEPLTNDIRAGRTISHLELIVSEGCNFACSHCIHSNDIASTENRKLNTYMSTATAKHAIDEFVAFLRANGRHEANIHFGAAEPLVNWPTIRWTIEYIKSITDLELNLSMVTNLALLDYERALHLTKNGVLISSSLDGNQLANDSIRIDRHGRGTFDLIVEKLHMLRDMGHPLNAITLTVTERNFSLLSIDEYLDLVQSLDMGGIGIDFDLVGSSSLNPIDVGDFLIAFYYKCQSRGLYCTGTWIKPLENLLVDREALGTPRTVGFCKAVEGGNVAVSPQGNLYMCGYTSSRLGSIDDINTAYVENLSQLIERRDEVVAKHCGSCDLRAVCRGQCHTTLEVSGAEWHRLPIQSASNAAKVDLMCDLYRHITKKMGADLARAASS